MVRFSPHDAALRATAAARDHVYVGPDGAVRERAKLTLEQADQATLRVYLMTGRRYRRYACRNPQCGGWHIRPCPLRAKDMARTA